jgi:HK97 family phage major capsid protein
MEETEKYLGEPATGPVIPITNETQEEKLDNGGFKNVAEFLHCVKNGDSKGRLKSLASSDAGILIPPQFSQSILMLNSEDEIIMPRATNIPAGDPPDAPFVIPYFQQGADGALGGIQLTWTNEAKTVSDTKDPVIKDLTLAPQECSGLATVNNKTLANWQAAGAFIQTLLRQAWISGRDLKFLHGSGSGCPLGIYNAPGALKIKRETSSKITYLDIVTMVSRLYGEGLWIINKTIMPTLMTLQDPEGHYIFNGGDATKGIPATLIGLPIKWNGKSPTLGSKGDLTLVDLKYYLTKAGSGPYVAISEHVKFTTNQTVFKIVANTDGQPWVKDPLLLDDGKTTVSPYVILN